MKRQFPNQGYRLGVLGGGQLGKMMGIAAADWHLPISFLDQYKTFPAGPVSHAFTEGDFADYEAVMSFGRDKDFLTIEIEHVNVEALEALEKEGVIVHPRPSALRIIKDKGLQKTFYADHDIPTAPFQLFDSALDIRQALDAGKLKLPFVQKSRTAGYDGKGVLVVKEGQQLDQLMDTPSMVEDLAPIRKELAVIVARNERGQVATYPVVEMEFNPVANLVEYLLCPARIPQETADKANAIAKVLIEKLNICGLLAVEFFWNEDGSLWVNEVAPRPHNSGHHTIDSCETSQFEQHLRAVLDLPLGATDLHSPAVMVNLLGEDKHTGPACYQGMDACLAKDGVHIHLYGKADTKPFRKMGHVTVTAGNLGAARANAEQIKHTLKVVTE